MTIKENLVIKNGEKNILFNLYNFKTVELDYQSLSKLEEYINSGTGVGKEIFIELLEKNQFLTDEDVKKIDLISKINVKKQLKERNNDIGAIQINFSYKCNFHCNYCYQQDFNFKESMNYIDIDKIFEFCDLYTKTLDTNNKNNTLILSGGEPLLSENIEIINYTVNKFNNSDIYIYTNGVNLLKYWDYIPVNKITGFQVSLDGDDNTISYNSLKGNPSFHFKDIIAGIHKIIDSGLELTISTVLTEKSFFKQAVKLVSILEKEKILNREKVRLIFSSVVDCSKKTGISDIYELEDFIEQMEKLKKYICNYDNIQVAAFTDMKMLAKILSGKEDFEKLHLGLSCNHIKGVTLNFTPDGGVYWCNETIGKEGKIGDYKKQEIDINKIEQINNRNIFKIEKCKSCLYRYICNSGCSLRVGASKTSWDHECCGIFENAYILDNIGKLL